MDIPLHMRKQFIMKNTEVVAEAEMLNIIILRNPTVALLIMKKLLKMMVDIHIMRKNMNLGEIDQEEVVVVMNIMKKP